MSYLLRRCPIVLPYVFRLLHAARSSLRRRAVCSRSSRWMAKIAGPVSSAGVLANQTLYVAGQDGRNADGSLPKDFQQEVSQSLSNVQGVLRAAGMDFGNVVWMNIYVTNAQDIAAMNDVYWKSIGANPPARTVLVVGALPNGEKIEINCIAVSSAATSPGDPSAGMAAGTTPRSGRNPGG